ncbi:MAG: hypothetical protein HYZ36_03500 [Pedosphaera parvula]|nr:hypothetical protein [Pedosphaera parvula]
MRNQLRLVVVAALAATFHTGMAADITGKITLQGTPPPEKQIPLDPTCGKLHPSGKMSTRFYAVGKDGGLADVFVHITEGLAKKDYPVPAQAVEIDQKGCEYLPYVVGAQTKQKIVFKNSDPVLHNVHPTPQVPGNKEYNKAQLPGGPMLDFTWDKPEVFLRVKCDVHPWMFTWIGLVEDPFFAVSDKDGNFKIANVPPGTYTVEVNHRKAGKATQKVTVGGEGKKVAFSLKVP